MTPYPDVNLTLVLAIALVVGVILAFLRTLSSILITALILPTSVLGTFAVMYLLGYSLNNLVLENISRHMEMGKDRRLRSWG